MFGNISCEEPLSSEYCHLEANTNVCQYLLAEFNIKPMIAIGSQYKCPPIIAYKYESQANITN
jgi:hypothetical protein